MKSMLIWTLIYCILGVAALQIYHEYAIRDKCLDRNMIGLCIEKKPDVL